MIKEPINLSVKGASWRSRDTPQEHLKMMLKGISDNVGQLAKVLDLIQLQLTNVEKRVWELGAKEDD